MNDEPKQPEEVWEAHLRAVQQQHDRMEQRMKEMSKMFEFHLGEQHQHLVESQQIKKWDGEVLNKVDGVQETVDKLAAEILGPIRYDFDGKPYREVAAGLNHQVGRNTDILNDIRTELRSGVEFSLSNRQMALLTAVVALITGIIQL